MIKLNKKSQGERISRGILSFSTTMILFLLLLLSLAAAVNFGSVDISPLEILQIAGEKIFGLDTGHDIGRNIGDIVWLIRMPRLVLAALVGAGLSLCGVVMQAVVRNPMADPYTLGLSSGASLGATAAIMLGVGSFLGENYVGACAFIGALGTVFLVMTVANLKGRANSMKLLLAGMAISTMCSSLSSFIIYFSNNREGMRTITFWLMGSFAGAKWETMGVTIFVVLSALVFFRTQYRTLNLMLVGDDAAITLGKNLHKYRQVYLMICAVVVGFLVFNSGIIGFVGLIIPHVTRMVLGTDHKGNILPSALLGSILLVWADVLSRVIIKGSEMPVGIIISLIGAPCFIYLIVGKKYGFGGGR